MIKTIESRWGPCTFFLKDEYVGRSIYNYGEYNPDETEKIISLASGHCLDIGANIGVISMALLASGFKVTAFEPQPAVCDLTISNCIGAKVYNSAVGASAGVTQMPRVYYSSKGNFGGLSCGTTSQYGSYEVPVMTIDSLGLDDVGFMKIDVEGYEYQVLCGASETIARCKPIMYIEDDRMEKRTQLRQKITDLGYKFEMHQPELYRENNFLGLKKNIWEPKRYASHNLICTPC